MKPSDKNELLDKYFWGECTQNEIDYLFELAQIDEGVKEELQINHNLRKLGEIEYWKNSPLPEEAKRLLQQYETEKLNKKEEIIDPEILKIINESDKDNLKQSKLQKWVIRLGYLLLVIILCVLGYKYFFHKPSPPEKKEINIPIHIAMVERHLEHTDNYLGSRAADAVLLNKGAVNYTEKNYAKASEYLLQVVSQNPKDNDVKFYLGKCYLHITKGNEAIKIFQQILNTTNSDDFSFYEETRLNLALGLIMTEEYLRANEILNQLKKEELFQEKILLIQKDLEFFIKE